MANRHNKATVISRRVEYMDLVHKGAIKGLTLVGLQGVSDVKDSFKSASGRPSPAGTPPANQSGKLTQSIAFSVQEESLDVFVGSNVEYARIQELGGRINHPGGTPYIMTDSGARFLSFAKAKKIANDVEVRLTAPHKINLPARPYLSTTLNANTTIYTKIVHKSIKSEVGRKFKTKKGQK